MSNVRSLEDHQSAISVNLGMTNETAAAWADRFWAGAGRSETFPRDLETAISWALPLAVVKLPHLTLEQTRVWMISRRICTPSSTADRPLRACLVARAGRGVVLVDGSDSADERRMSLAHEVAHFLLDYLRPRERAAEVMGASAQEVLDGVRAPTAAEQLAGVLDGLYLGTYRHLIDRSETGVIDRVAVVEGEDRADRLALELLAPRLVVVAQVAGKLPSHSTVGVVAEVTESVLIRDFGLPRVPARRYAQVVVGGSLAGRSFREWLGA